MEGELQSKLSQTHSGEEYFRIQLTNQQYIFLQQHLPKGYSFQIDSKSNKRQSTKFVREFQNEQIPNEDEIAQVSRIRKTPSTTIYNNTIENTQTLKTTNIYRRTSEINLSNEQQLKPCMRIVKQLKNSRTSWPFRQPVDPIKFGIPNYSQIIQQPMDLQTIQKNLKNNQYVTATQFHADVNKIIRNSYVFNQNNADFVKITSQFEKYYFKLLSDAKNTNSQEDIPLVNPQTKTNPKKTKKRPSFQPKEFNELQPPTLIQKKQLSQHIRRLNKEDLKGVVQIVYAGKSQMKDTFDIEDLDHPKIRQLQRYVRSKLTINELTSKAKNQKNEKNENPSTNQIKADGDESSFVMEDSDS